MVTNKLKEIVLAVLESKLERAREYFEHMPDGPWVISQSNGLSIDSIEIHRCEGGGLDFNVLVSGSEKDELRVLGGIQAASLIAEWAPMDLGRICKLA